MVDEKEHDFQKKLADLQIKAGVIATQFNRDSFRNYINSKCY